jgi:ABC-type proline/glycine betaine transport system permease subunit
MNYVFWNNTMISELLISKLSVGTLPAVLCRKLSAVIQVKQCTYNVGLRRVRVNIVDVWKGITYSEFASVALGIQHVNILRHILSSSVSFPALQYFFPTLSH